MNADKRRCKPTMLDEQKKIEQLLVSNERYLRRGLLLFLWDYRCVYCGSELSIQPCDEKECTFDHVQPVSQGGADVLSNFVPACKTCNSHRGNIPMADFLRDLKHSEEYIQAVCIRVEKIRDYFAMCKSQKRTHQEHIEAVRKVSYQKRVRFWETLCEPA